MPSKAPARNDVDGRAEEVRKFSLQPREREKPESFWPIDEKVNVGLRRVRPARDAAKYPDVAGPVCRREVTHLPSVPDKPSPQICRSAKPEKTRHFWLASACCSGDVTLSHSHTCASANGAHQHFARALVQLVSGLGIGPEPLADIA